jgi:hypothetical protein
MITQNQFKYLRQIEAGISRNLFLICGIATVLSMLMITVEFFSRGAFPPSQIGQFYLGILIIYSLHKELIRWLGKRKMERQGEYFVYTWIGLTVALYVIDFLTRGYFTRSAGGEPLTVLRDLSTLTLEVLVIFMLTRGLKILKVFVVKSNQPSQKSE